jgi:hypothetical protein
MSLERGRADVSDVTRRQTLLEALEGAMRPFIVRLTELEAARRDITQHLAALEDVVGSDLVVDTLTEALGKILIRLDALERHCGLEPPDDA